MAYVQQIPEEEKNQFAPKSQTTPNPIPPQAGGSVGAGGQGGANAPGGNVPNVGSSTQFGSNASKLSDYLKVNQPQIENWGNQIAGTLSQGYNQTMGDINQGFGSFTNQVQGSYTPPSQDQVQQALAKPDEFAKSDQNVKNFQQWYAPQYSGPQNFEGSDTYQNLNNEVNQAVQNANLVKTPSGLGTYLNTQMGGGYQETPGMQGLDVALLQGNPNVQQTISQAAQPYQNLSSYLGNQATQANQAIAGKQAQINQSGQDVRSATQKAVDQFQQDLANRVSQAQTSAQNAGQGLLAAIQQEVNLTPQEQAQIPNWSDIQTLEKELGGPTPDMAYLGASAYGASPQYGVKTDLTPYLTQQNPQTAITQANVATPADYARAAALAKLTGGQFNLLPSDTSQAGTAPTNLASFNNQQAATDLRNQLTGLDTQFINQYSPFVNQAVQGKNLFNVSPGMNDAVTAKNYQEMIDIFNRNPNLLNAQQKSDISQLQTLLSQGNPNINQGTNPGTPTPGSPDYVSPNLRVTNGQQMWFNGSDWVPAPPEFTGFVNGGYTQQFNYDTGQYEPTGWTGQPTTPGTTGPGLATSGGGGPAGIY